MPNWLVLMNQVDVVKKPKPIARSAVAARKIRKTRISPVMRKTARPAERRMPRKTLSPRATGATMVRGLSSVAAGCCPGVSATAMMVCLPHPVRLCRQP